MLNDVTYVDAEIADRCDRGVDYGAEGTILLRWPRSVQGRRLDGKRPSMIRQDILLIWRKASTVWSGIGSPRSYVQAHLEAIIPGNPVGVDIFSGRFSPKRIAENIDALRAALRLPDLDADQIKKGKTLYVGGDRKWPDL